MSTPIDPTWRSTAPPTPTGGDGSEFASGQRLGCYVIRRLLGRGGMGVVYLADQIEPVRRPVALKLIRPAFADSLAEAYFEVERQALARMDHPGIAKVLEAGTTPEGLPFFAMEWIDGPTLDDYLAQANPDLQARLDLLRQVALGAHHAHQRGVVHRDLKPGNVLVPLIDGRAVPKIIDFGVAVGIGQGGRRSGDYAGTSLYMSPEQAGLTDSNVDVRSDVYSLGVMLLEMLAPAGTLDALRERGIGASKLSQVLRTERPPGPTTHQDATEWLSLPALRAIPRELRHVIARATDVQRDARYGSAQALAEDLANFRADLPLAAVPATRTYIIGKFVRRHRLPLLAGAAVVVALVVGLGAAIFALLQAQTERERAEQAAQRATREAARSRSMADFLGTVLAGIEPEQARGLDTKLLRQVLDQAAARAQRDLAGDAEQLADIEATIGRAYRSIAVLDKAEEFLGRALERQRQRLGPDAAVTFETERFLLWSISEHGREGEALPRARELRARAERVLGANARETLLQDLATGWFEYLAGNMKPAEALLRTASDGLAATGPDDAKALDALGRLGIVLADSGQYDAARPLYDRVLAGYTKLFGEEDPRTLGANNSLGVLAMQQRRHADGEREFRRMLPIYERLYGPDHAQTLALVLNMSGALRQQGKVAESGPYYRRAYDGMKAKFGPDNLRTLIAQNNLANYLIDAGEAKDAVAMAQEAVNRSREPYASNRIILGEFHFTLGKALFASRQLAAAETELRLAWDLRSAEMGATAEDARDVARKLAELKRALKRESEAREWEAKAAGS
jgi:non-specific serine/threonine protein kinase/serine/threonine-protein kinase